MKYVAPKGIVSHPAVPTAVSKTTGTTSGCVKAGASGAAGWLNVAADTSTRLQTSCLRSRPATTDATCAGW